MMKTLIIFLVMTIAFMICSCENVSVSQKDLEVEQIARDEYERYFDYIDIGGIVDNVFQSPDGRIYFLVENDDRYKIYYSEGYPIEPVYVSDVDPGFVNKHIYEWKLKPIVSDDYSTFVIAGDNVMRSSDRGNTWCKIDVPSCNSMQYELEKGENEILYCSLKELYNESWSHYSTDYGLTWQRIGISKDYIRSWIVRSANQIYLICIDNISSDDNYADYHVYKAKGYNDEWELIDEFNGWHTLECSFIYTYKAFDGDIKIVPANIDTNVYIKSPLDYQWRRTNILTRKFLFADHWNMDWPNQRLFYSKITTDRLLLINRWYCSFNSEHSFLLTSDDKGTSWNKALAFLGKVDWALYGDDGYIYTAFRYGSYDMKEYAPDYMGKLIKTKQKF